MGDRDSYAEAISSEPLDAASGVTRRRVLTFAALSAAAGLATRPMGRAEAGAAAGAVGAWLIAITSTSAPYQGVQIVHADGTLSLTFAPSGPPASGQPPRLYAPGAGVWSRTNDCGYDFALTAISLTVDGLYQGQVVVSGHATLDESGQTLSASYTSRSSSADGGLVGNNSGTIAGIRIALGT